MLEIYGGSTILAVSKLYREYRGGSFGGYTLTGTLLKEICSTLTLSSSIRSITMALDALGIRPPTPDVTFYMYTEVDWWLAMHGITNSLPAWVSPGDRRRETNRKHPVTPQSGTGHDACSLGLGDLGCLGVTFKVDLNI